MFLYSLYVVVLRLYNKRAYRALFHWPRYMFEAVDNRLFLFKKFLFVSPSVQLEPVRFDRECQAAVYPAGAATTFF